jgi:hypothetical protein
LAQKNKSGKKESGEGGKKVKNNGEIVENRYEKKNNMLSAVTESAVTKKIEKYCADAAL